MPDEETEAGWRAWAREHPVLWILSILGLLMVRWWQNGTL